MFICTCRGYSPQTLRPYRDSSHLIEGSTLTMVTKNNFNIRGGGADAFGKCTYNPMQPQTDHGYAKFYSILKFLVGTHILKVTGYRWAVRTLAMCIFVNISSWLCLNIIRLSKEERFCDIQLHKIFLLLMTIQAIKNISW